MSESFIDPMVGYSNVNSSGNNLNKGYNDMELTDEDLKKMQDINLMIERLSDPNSAIVKNTLDLISNEIRTSTTSMTAVPKPLKFLRPHFPTLVNLYESWPPSENKRFFADLLSVISMVVDTPQKSTLKYKLQGTVENVGVWGHEYLRCLADEISEAYEVRVSTGKDTSDLFVLVDEIVPYNMQHHCEPEACDLLMEVESLDRLLQFKKPSNYERICLYLISCSQFVGHPEDEQILRVVYEIYMSFSVPIRALQIAIKLGSTQYIQQVFESVGDSVDMRRQLVFILADHHLFHVLDHELLKEDPELISILNNEKLAQYFSALCKDLQVNEPKELEDIYKSLNESRSSKLESARLNMASSFVNGFVNAASCADKLMTLEKSTWISKNKDMGLLVTTASLGLIYLWNHEEGIEKLTSHMYVEDDYIKAGVSLGVGVMLAGIRTDFDSALNIALESLISTSSIIRTSAALGLAISYAGSQRADVIEALKAAFSDQEQSMNVLGIFSLSLGLVCVGSGNVELAMSLAEIFGRSSINSSMDVTYLRLVSIGIGLFFLGLKELSEPIIQIIQALGSNSPAVTKTASLIIESMAYVGSGNPVDIQRLLEYCNEHLECDDEFQGIAVLGLACVSMGEEIGTEMVQRMFEHLLRYGESNIRKAVPLALALTNLGNPNISTLNTLSKLSHDHDCDVEQGAILALGFVAAGSNNSRVAQMLRQLTLYYSRDQGNLYFIRIAQGLLHMGKGTISLNPFRLHGFTANMPSLGAILSILFAATDLQLLTRAPQLLFILAIAFHPNILMTLDNKTLESKPVPVRVGTAVNVVGQAGKPKTITGFQTHTSPVLLSNTDRAEFVTEQYLPESDILEGFVIVKPNPEYKLPEKHKI